MNQGKPGKASWLAALLLGAGTALAQPADPLQAIVGVSARVAADARTAATLGTERAGSGVLIDASGLIATIGYLILEADTARVELSDGAELPAEIVAYDSRSGFGLLRAIGKIRQRPVALGSAHDLRVDTPVLIASFGGPRSVRPALVTARREFAGYWEYLLPDAIFTAPPHPAFGGAALLDRDGRLLGIGSLAVNDAGTDGPLPGNLFVPIDALLTSLGDLLSAGRSMAPPRPWLGVFTGESQAGLRVLRVAEDGPGHSAGVRRGDIILAVAGDGISNMADFYRRVWALGDAGVEVPLTLLRDGVAQVLTLRSAERARWLRRPRGN